MGLGTMQAPTARPGSVGAASHGVTPEQRRIEEELVREHLPLVGYLVSEALGKLPSHVRREDLTAAGMTGLALAARGFEPERGVPFGRFAALRVRGAIVDELRSQDWASRGVRAKARTREQTIDALTGAMGRPPTPDELAESLGISVATLRTDEQDLHRALVLSLSPIAPGGEESGEGSEHLLPAEHRTPESELLEREQRAYLHDAIACLPDRLRIVITGYFLDDRPMAEIAAELGVTESRVSQMRGEAVALLRGSMNAHLGDGSPGERGRSDNPPADGLVARRRETYFASVGAHRDFRARLTTAAPAFTPAAAPVMRSA
jgi:RNA polymerase sigma factor for flagellar operon FliA